MFPPQSYAPTTSTPLQPPRASTIATHTSRRCGGRHDRHNRQRWMATEPAEVQPPPPPPQPTPQPAQPQHGGQERQPPWQVPYMHCRNTSEGWPAELAFEMCCAWTHGCMHAWMDGWMDVLRSSTSRVQRQQQQLRGDDDDEAEVEVGWGWRE